MAGRIVINKNIQHGTDESGIGSLFSGQYGKKEIIIDNTKGSEGIWILNEDGYLKKIEAKPAVDITLYSGLTDDQIVEIARDLITGDLSLQFAKQSEVNERVDELESQIVPEERVIELTTQAAEEAVQDIPSISEENIARIQFILSLFTNAESAATIDKLIDITAANHVALSETQYAELIASGYTTLDNGKTIQYNPNVYYNVYEDGQNPYDDDDEGEGSIDGIPEDEPEVLQVSFSVDESEPDVLLISGDATLNDYVLEI